MGKVWVDSFPFLSDLLFKITGILLGDEEEIISNSERVGFLSWIDISLHFCDQ